MSNSSFKFLPGFVKLFSASFNLSNARVLSFAPKLISFIAATTYYTATAYCLALIEINLLFFKLFDECYSTYVLLALIALKFIVNC